MIDALAPNQRVALDRRIAEEGCIEIDPPFQRPKWFWQVHGYSFVPNAFVMDRTGVMSRRWVKADEVNWSNAVAVRLETPNGQPLRIEHLGAEDEDYY